MAVDRQDTDLDQVVDGTSGTDAIGFGSRDADGDAVDGGDNVIAGGDGGDMLSGAGGNDTIIGGSGADIIAGDSGSGSGQGSFSPQVTDNVADGDWGTVSTANIRAVELVTLANGDLIMITSERSTSDDGIASARIDNDPQSDTYGQVIGGRIDDIRVASNGTSDGYDQIEDLAGITLSNGATFVYSADDNAIGVTSVAPDGTLTAETPITVPSSSEVQELEPPPLKWSAPIFRKRRTRNGKQATQARRDCYEVAAS